jgi:hypothetical protein
MSHARRADRLLIKPAAGTRPAPPCTRGRIIRKARTQHGQSLEEPHATRRHQAGDGPRQTDPPSLTVPRGEWDVRRVRDCLIPLDKVPVIRENEDAVDALAELSQSAGGHGLVVSNGGLAGIVSTSDLARALEARPRRRAPARV